jgi:cupin fold WbuC family metalloprotein
MLIEISRKITDPLKTRARHAPRKRVNYNYHSGMDDPINRMIHAMNPGTFVQPHKHESPDKREVFLILEGKVAAVEFNDSGCVTGHIVLSRDSENYGVEIPPRTWHCLIALEEDSLVYEVKDGPYSPDDDKFFASWAPSENDEEALRTDYTKSLLVQLGL